MSSPVLPQEVTWAPRWHKTVYAINVSVIHLYLFVVGCVQAEEFGILGNNLHTLRELGFSTQSLIWKNLILAIPRSTQLHSIRKIYKWCLSQSYSIHSFSLQTPTLDVTFVFKRLLVQLHMSTNYPCKLEKPRQYCLWRYDWSSQLRTHLAVVKLKPEERIQTWTSLGLNCTTRGSNTNYLIKGTPSRCSALANLICLPSLENNKTVTLSRHAEKFFLFKTYY